MFREILKEIVDSTDGGYAGLLMGLDGIPVDQYVTSGLDGVDAEAVGMEFSIVLQNIRRATEMLRAGNAEEVTIRAERFTCAVRYLSSEYFVSVILRPTGNIGKTRYMLRTRAQRLLDQLQG